MDDHKKILGKKIYYLRTRADMSQVELQKHIGLKSSGIISQVENGERGLTVENIIKAAKILGVHPAILLTPEPMLEEDLDVAVLFMKSLELKDKSYEKVKKLLNSSK